MLRMVLTVIQVFASFAIIGLVLLQRGKGADAGAGFGAGASGTVFGARGARTALSRATAVLAAVFMINSLALAYMGSHEAVAAPKTILDEAAGTPPPATTAPAPGLGTTTPAVPAPSATPAPQVEQSAPPAQAPASDSSPK
ncbi:MAG TPA: preprotein translocase subunit SecG [Steroidobacteraceae bacterium]|jgi:preprotein translocase subunit SecG|nr:preprotein translocase subunit SecG [Steroidobacteraceae bacterium]